MPFLFQLTDLEFVEEKERNQVYGRGALYVHSNFLVKGSDGKPTMFFAEMRPDCTGKRMLFSAPLWKETTMVSW